MINIYKIGKKLLHNKNIYSLIFSLLTFYMLVFQISIDVFSPFSWIIFICIFLFYNKLDFYKKNNLKSSLFISILFSFLIIYGKICYDTINQPEIDIFKILFSLKSIISFCGLCVLIFVFISNIFTRLKKISIFEKRNVNVKKFFLIVFVGMVLCWLPYLLSLYPGELSTDSIAEVGIIYNNFSEITNHHPIIHVLFIAIPYKAIYILTNNINLSVAFSLFFQMLIMSFIYSYLLTFLYKKNVKKIILIFVFLFYSIVPSNAIYSVTMWKDIVFSGLVLMFVINIFKIYEVNKLTKKQMIIFSIISLLMVLFRNNAIYMYFIFAVVATLIMKKVRKQLLMCLISVIVVYYIILFPIFNILNVKRSASGEYIAIPLQQIGYIVHNGNKLTKKEKKLIDDLIDIDVLKQSYMPISVDFIKFNNNYHRDVFDNNKIEYLKLWARLVLKYPKSAIQAYSYSTLGYWYPAVDNWVICDGVAKNDMGIKRKRLMPNVVNNFIDKMDSKSVPIFGLFWSTSLSLYLIVISLIVALQKDKKSFILYVPVFGMWFTMMIAAPVYAEYRYIYCTYTTLPLMLLIPFMLNRKKIQ